MLMTEADPSNRKNCAFVENAVIKPKVIVSVLITVALIKPL